MKRPRKRNLYKLLPKGIWKALKRLYRWGYDVYYCMPEQCEIESFLAGHNRIMSLYLLKGYQVYLIERITQKCPLQKGCFVMYQITLSEHQEGRNTQLEYCIYYAF